MKKLISIILSFVMITSLISGCGKDTRRADATTTAHNHAIHEANLEIDGVLTYGETTAGEWYDETLSTERAETPAFNTEEYHCAEKHFIEGGNNRVIIASDGDMNLGITSQSGLVDLITEKKESGVFLTTLGFGYGNYSNANMESLADAGNGNYFYIDSIDEAERVLCAKMMQTTVTVAKDVKFQLEFNPAEVKSYRQIGYENRQMASSDFTDDTKDGGEIGAGAQVTVCYELVLADGASGDDDGLKYQDPALSEEANSGELCTVSVRYKKPDADKSEELQYPLKDNGISNEDDFNFVCGVIEASLVLRDSEYKGTATYQSAIELAKSGANDNRYREEFCELIEKLD